MADRDDAVYIAEVLDAITLACRFVAGMTEDDFLDDLKTQSAVIRQLEIIGEACAHVSKRTRMANPEIPWGDAVATRNLLIHQYFGVDPDTVWMTVRDDLPVLAERLAQLKLG